MSAFNLNQITQNSTIIIVGRRATGKTHLAKYLINELKELLHFGGGFIVNIDEEKNPNYTDYSDDIYLEFDQDEFDNFCLNKSSKYLLIDNITDTKNPITTHNNLTIITNNDYFSLRTMNLNPQFVFLLKETKVNDIRKYHEAFNLKVPFNKFKDLVTSLPDYKPIVIDVINNNVFILEKSEVVQDKQVEESELESEEEVAPVIASAPITLPVPEPVTEPVIAPVVAPITLPVPEPTTNSVHLPELTPEEQPIFSEEEILLGVPIKNILSEIKNVKQSLITQLNQKSLASDSFEFNAMVEKKKNKALHEVLKNYSKLIDDLDVQYKLFNDVKAEYMNSL